MRSFRSLLSLALCVFVLMSCYKNKPRKGTYKAQFCYSQDGKVEILPCEIYESNKNWVYLGITYNNGLFTFKDTLYKQKEKIGGYLNYNVGSTNNPIKVEGKIHKESSGFTYMIEGTFMYFTNNGTVETTYPAGDFKIYKD